jgi:hypothetical protein
MLKIIIPGLIFLTCAACADTSDADDARAAAQLTRDVNTLAEAGVTGVQAEQSGTDSNMWAEISSQAV